jgi:hypothetical protein
MPRKRFAGHQTGETEMADLVERCDLRRAGAALSDHQRPDRFDVAVTGLARTLRSPGQRGAGGFGCPPIGQAASRLRNNHMAMAVTPMA